MVGHGHLGKTQKPFLKKVFLTKNKTKTCGEILML
jgi:hypothetical protein